ncbi:hypothetical protein AYO44_05530 [Planctomycetaceae bacterium SCGC AG-212-F19]|nr:hypothetical protein AYO44_05530 [Planctomycetaceae bacterium SCGC AG-212-F19]
MNLLKRACAAVVVFGLVAVAGADEKGDANKEKLLGKWETSKGGIKVANEFFKNGKVKVTLTIDGQSEKMDGTFQVEGDQVHITLKMDGKEKKTTATIKMLTDKKLVVVDDRKRTDEFKKVK